MSSFKKNDQQRASMSSDSNRKISPVAIKIIRKSSDETPISRNDNNRATLASCILNLSNTIIGTGMLGLPGAFSGTGYLGGILLLLLSAIFSAHGLVLLAKSAEITGVFPSSFYSIAHRAMPKFTIFIDFGVALKCFGVATGYLITIADCMVDAFDDLVVTGDESSFLSSLALSRRFWVIFGVCAVLPMSFFRTLDSLKRASAAALAIVILLAAAVVAYAQGWFGWDPCEGHNMSIEDPTLVACHGKREMFTNVPQTLQKLPIFIFAFTCQQNIFPIVNEIQNRTMTRLTIVAVTAIGLAFVTYVVVAIEGYNTYGSNLRGNLLLNYPKTHIVTALRICVATLLILHYPLQMDPARRCILSLIASFHPKQKVPIIRISSSEEEEEEEAFKITKEQELIERVAPHSETKKPKHNFSLLGDESSQYLIPKTELSSPVIGEQLQSEGRIIFVAVTILFLLLSVSIALVVQNLGTILSIVGASGSTLVTYILPGLIYVKLHPAGRYNIFAYLQFFLGCAIMPSALYWVISGFVKE